MELDLEWHDPFEMRDTKNRLAYRIPDFDEIPTSPGLYAFARNHGAVIEPLYIGRAYNLRTRIGQQLNNLRLMAGIREASSGYRLLLVGEYFPKQGQQLDRALAVMESAFIRSAAADGYDLLNVHGTRAKAHRICSRGSRDATSWFSRNMHVVPGA